MEKFPKKEKNLKPIEAADKILKSIGISQLAESELSDNGKNQPEKESENNLIGRKHRGGTAPSVFEKLKKVSGPDKDDLNDESDPPEWYTNPYDGE